MASIRREMQVAASAEHIWEVVRDVGEIHRRLVPGFVTDCRLVDEGEARIVTFGNGVVVREAIVDVDDAARRLAWSATGGQLTHYNASMQVFAEDGTHSRMVWIADLLPHEAAGAIGAMIDEGMRVMKQTLEGA
jgi:carbon monoxide dehydrogenase subunit G